MATDTNWIRTKAKGALYPAQVERTLSELDKIWPTDATSLRETVEQFPLGESALLHLLSVSTICAARIAQDPSVLNWLARPEVSLEKRERAQMSNDLHAMAGDVVATDNFRALRIWKGRQMVRIALREIAEVAPLEETTAELSQIAEICIRRVFEHWNTELRQKHGSPDAVFAILGLGKLGGRELNHSSDVDLIFLYSDEGQLSGRLTYHEFFNRLGKKILETFSTPDPAGSLFRVDLRLRPEGSAGPLARSLDSMEHYYSGFGETWERLALIKARAVAGDRELAYEFLQQHQPFIYPKSPTPDLLDEIAAIKRRIERDVVGQERLARDVKLGRGGIREIEFVVQTLQFIHGARQTFLQDPSTLKALQALAQLELISHREVVDLDRAYRFLRRVEHRLQIEAEQQTHSLPESSEQLHRLAVSLQYPSTKLFLGALEQQTDAVRAIFQRVISEGAPGIGGEIDDLQIFLQRVHAERALNDLVQSASNAHVAPRTRQVFRKLRPLLLTELSQIADADATLNQFVRFVQSYGMRSMLFELLATNPKLLELVVKTFDASRFASDLLVRNPQLLEESTRPGKLDRAMTTVDYIARFRVFRNDSDVLDKVRAYRQAQLLRIVLRDVLGLADSVTVSHEQSDLAEAGLIFVNEILGGTDLTIVAMGKFGGCELSYGADLDVLFVGNESAPAQKLLAALAQPSAEGNFARVDARLRPDGEKGSLVASLSTFESYYRTRAQFWEIQSLTRARAICGPEQDEFMTMAREIWQETGTKPDLPETIDSMLWRIRRDRGSGSDFLDFKTGIGGLIEAEFLIQALQMRANIWQPNWAEAVDALQKAGHLPAFEAGQLKEAYSFLRRSETVLRRHENRSVSALPANQEERNRFYRRFGLPNPDQYLAEYHAARASIHQIYNQIMQNARVPAG